MTTGRTVLLVLGSLVAFVVVLVVLDQRSRRQAGADALRASEREAERIAATPADDPTPSAAPATTPAPDPTRVLPRRKNRTAPPSAAEEARHHDLIETCRVTPCCQPDVRRIFDAVEDDLELQHLREAYPKIQERFRKRCPLRDLHL